MPMLAISSLPRPMRSRPLSIRSERSSRPLFGATMIATAAPTRQPTPNPASATVQKLDSVSSPNAFRMSRLLNSIARSSEKGLRPQDAADEITGRGCDQQRRAGAFLDEPDDALA